MEEKYFNEIHSAISKEYKEKFSDTISLSDKNHLIDDLTDRIFFFYDKLPNKNIDPQNLKPRAKVLHNYILQCCANIFNISQRHNIYIAVRDVFRKKANLDK